MKARDCALVLLFGFTLWAAVPSPAETAPASDAQAAAHLALAEAYLQSGDMSKAEEQVLKAIQAAPEAAAQRTKALDILVRVLGLRHETVQAGRRTADLRNRALLAEADRLVGEGRLDEAAKLTADTLKSLEDPHALAAAEERLRAAHPGWWRSKWAQHVQRGWIGDALLILLVLWLLYMAARAVRFLVGFLHRRSWLVGPIEDKTGLGLGDLILANLHRWGAEETPASAGLLKLGTVELQTVPQFRQEVPKVDFASALASLPQVGAVAPGAVMKVLEALPSWINSGRPAIAGSACVVDGQVVVRLTCTGRGAMIQTISAVATKEIRSCVAAAEEVSFKMYYLIANESTVADAEAADRLRLGLQQLRSYVSTGQSKALDDARELFTSVRSQHPTLPEAVLYEGVALDLQEKHDEAEVRFHHLATTAQGEIRERARYNEAIAKFRRYRYDELEKAIAALETLIGEEVLNALEESFRLSELASSPIKALSLAAKANAIAHRPIFWQRLLFEGTKVTESHEVLERKRASRARVEGWISEVEQITTQLERLNAIVSSEVGEGQKNRLDARPSWWERVKRRFSPSRVAEKWDGMAIRQLQWAIQNARGNVYLNCANSFLLEPHLPSAGEPELRKGYLETARVAFQQCEMLLPPGVETLSNLATVYLSLGRTDRAREYGRMAIVVNPNYEYAYYRLAQAWEKDGKLSEAREVMKSFPKPPRIQEFQDMFQRLGVEARAA
ncbi:MAG: tetratricopeptide repeat protein [Acidobacteria bacterium]|nr:tetratricopeptide repeat protein [Acidobacteriota bacterium]